MLVLEQLAVCMSHAVLAAQWKTLGLTHLVSKIP